MTRLQLLKLLDLANEKIRTNDWADTTNFKIDADVSDWYDIIKVGRTKQERIRILIMLFFDNNVSALSLKIYGSISTIHKLIKNDIEFMKLYENDINNIFALIRVFDYGMKNKQEFREGCKILLKDNDTIYYVLAIHPFNKTADIIKDSKRESGLEIKTINIRDIEEVIQSKTYGVWRNK